MKIYQVSYIGGDDNTYSEFYSNKAEAEKNKRKLEKICERELVELDTDDFGSYTGMKNVFDIHEMECKISKTGILDLLNNHFGEKAG